jgi:hypothetical protein
MMTWWIIESPTQSGNMVPHHLTIRKKSLPHRPLNWLTLDDFSSVQFPFSIALAAEKRIPEKHSDVEKSLNLPSKELVNL